MKPIRQCPGRPGFTLVELLVTLAIIGVLAALLLPALARARGKSRQTACASNLRQIGIAFYLFGNDHGGLFPQRVSTNAGGALELSRFPEPLLGLFVRSPAPFASVSNELGSPRVLACPAVGRGPSNFATLRAADLGYWVTTSATLGDALGALAVDKNLDPARTRRITNALSTGFLEVSWTQERHDGRGNTLWGDGHVDSRRALQVAMAMALGAGGGGVPAANPADGALPRSNDPGSRSGGGRHRGNGGAGNPASGLPQAGGDGSALGASAVSPSGAGQPAAGLGSRSPGRTRPVAASSIPAWTGLEIDGDREARERQDRWIQRSVGGLILLCMALGLMAVIAHAWQRYRALS